MANDSGNNIVLTGRNIGQDALQTLAEAHRRFVLQRRDGRRVIMRDCTMSGLDFRRLCFAGAHFLGCRFTGADLTGADFRRARLFGSNFEAADLTHANFARADLRAVIFDRAVLNETSFDQADLRRGAIISRSSERAEDVFSEIRSSFRDAVLRRTNLQGARLKDVDFSGATLDGTALDGADLRGARFTGVEFDGVGLQNARLEDADLRAASIENLDLDLAGLLATPATPLDASKLHRALVLHETWTESGGAQGKRADFTEHNLVGLDLAGRSLATISFAHANLKGIDLRGAVLAACDFTNANLREADLSRSDLRGANFTGAVLSGTRLASARVGTLPETGMRTLLPKGVDLAAAGADRKAS